MTVQGQLGLRRPGAHVVLFLAFALCSFSVPYAKAQTPSRGTTALRLTVNIVPEVFTGVSGGRAPNLFLAEGPATSGSLVWQAISSARGVKTRETRSLFSSGWDLEAVGGQRQKIKTDWLLITDTTVPE